MTTTPEPDPPGPDDSLVNRLARLDPADRDQILDGLDPAVVATLLHDWRLLARPDQLPPSTDPALPWLIWLVIGGRGAGKSRTVAEWAHDRAIEHYRAQPPNRTERHRIGAGSRSAADGRDVLVEGESGLLAVAERRGLSAEYQPSKRRIVWPDINCWATLFSAEEPDQARGPQYHTVIGDEFAAWDFTKTDSLGNNLWTNLLFGLRLGDNPQAAVSTTPKRVAQLRALVKRAIDADDYSVTMTRASTMANRANLSPVFIEQVVSQYEGTRLYQQEVLGILLDDDDEALWTPETIALTHRFLDPALRPNVPGFAKTVIGVDPPTSLSRDECGIVGVSLLAAPLPGLTSRCAAVRADRSIKGSPERWGKRVVQLARELGTNDVVAESNQGGQMVRAVIQNEDETGTIRVHLVNATTSKRLRAEPVSQLYEQQRVVHLDRFVTLEDQMENWTPEETDSPDRLDALVHGITHLIPELNRRPSTLSDPSAHTIDRSNRAVAAALLARNGSSPLYRSIARPSHRPDLERLTRILGG